jgi:glycerophosphoryl diester phosphodiesterase
MECIAHRGFAGTNPENTIPAVRGAAAVADWIEVDVWRCGSGELVVIHDPTVDRVTDASGRVAEMTVSELAALDVCNSGAGIPTLDAILEAIPSTVGVAVELKAAGLAAATADLLGERGGPGLVSSFDPDVIAEVDRVGDLPTALIGADDPDRVLAEARALGCGAVCLHHESCRPGVVDRARADGRSVYAWTVRERAVADRCFAAGVDGLISDDPAYCPDG